MLTDFERAWLALKAVVVSKRSHGQKDLLVEMARIEVDCSVDGDGFDPNPRRGPLHRDPARSRGMAETTHPLTAEEAGHGRNGKHDEGARGAHRA